jgi:diguanylate cyclase (GGDEF)-like protein/PAS domain S-box-containing protein
MNRRGRDDFSTLFDFLPIGAYRSAPDGRQIRANAALVELNGYTSEAEMFASIGDLGIEWYVEPGRRERFMELLERDGKVTQFVSEVYRHQTREKIWVTENAHVVKDRNGVVQYYEGTVEDVTDLTRAMHELRHNLLILSAIQELAAVGGVHHDLVTHRVTLTDQIYRLLDLDPSTHVPSPATVLDYFAPQSRPIIAKAVEHSNATGEPYDLELEMVTATGRHIWVHTKNVVERIDGVTVKRTALLQDITERKKANAIIWRQANFDNLTGLPNRQMLKDRLEQSMLRGKRNLLQVALISIDLDNFKDVNDSFGHEFGDQLLVEVGQRIQARLRTSDTVARMGGDEFMVVVSAPPDAAMLGILAQSVLDILTKPFRLAEHWVYISASAGIAVCPPEGMEMESLLKQADQALYAAKTAGRNRFAYFTPSLQDAAETKARLANDLRDAIAKGELAVVYQPIVELSSGRIFKAEALVRWRHPARGNISPAIFIPIAEASQLIHDIGDWVLRQAAVQVLHWRSSRDPDFQVTVNKSPAQFRDGPAALTRTRELLQTLSLPGSSLVFEITEGLLMDARGAISEQLASTRALGIQMALDDFGTGYSSLAYVQRFDIDYLKIDQSFVRDLPSNSRNHAICKAMIVMAHELGMRVIAEGVETEEQHALLKEAGCDFAQGYWLGKPVDASLFPGPSA